MNDISNDFIETYILTCVNSGSVSPKSICETALKEIKEIDEKLVECNGLRTQKKQLQAVLRSFNHESIQRHKRTNDVFVNQSILDSDQDPTYKETVLSICGLVESTNEPVTIRQIMDAVGGLEKNNIAYPAIKWLLDNGVLSRNEDRSIIRGEKWEDRIKEAS